MTPLLHIRALEAEAIHILRDGVAEAERPVILFSGGKDSTVLAHLAVKAFRPARPPVPLLHVDSTWEFADVLAFRDAFAARHGFELMVHHNAEGKAKGLNPVEHGDLYTSVMRTEALRQALDAGRHDVIFGGARRDEEATRAKERIVSVRGRLHAWDPKAQRPELWSIYNWRRGPDQTLRVYPISNWTERDLWTYIVAEEIPLCPLYFARERVVAESRGKLIVLDDAAKGAALGFADARRAVVRFRSLGCWPVTAAEPSGAASLEDILTETVSSRVSERSGRVSDGGSLEAQKRQGYF